MTDRDIALAGQPLVDRYITTYSNRDRQQVVQHFWSWVCDKALIMHRKYPKTERDEFASVGVLGLCSALEHYDSSRNTLFLNYATKWVWGNMRQFVMGAAARHAVDNFDMELALTCDDRAIQKVDDQDEVEHLTRELSSHDKSLLYYRFWCGLSFPAMARKLGPHHNTLARSYHRILNTLRSAV